MPAPAQNTDANVLAPPTPVQLRTPDGSRFVLIADPSLPHVHWAVATWTDGSCDPDQLPGLSQVTHRLSLGGTFRTGSRDPVRERAALSALDEAWQQKMLRPGDEAASAAVRTCDDAAQQLADPTTFPRVMAALPVHRPELVDRGATSALVLTTIPNAIGDVGALLVERREDQALRGLPQQWMEFLVTRLQQHATDPLAILRYELLALVMPSHPFAPQLERPPFVAPRRDAAVAAWQASQRPERTVHVLLGDFDADAVGKVLQSTFAATELPAWTPPATPTMRLLTGTRRSQVPNCPLPTVALAWVLPPIQDRFVLAAAAHWLGEGPDSCLGRELVRTGRTGATVRCVAPWPPTIDGQSLLTIEITDPSGIDGVLDLALATLRAPATVAPNAASLAPVNAALQRQWRERTDNPRTLAVEIATGALLWPTQPIATHWPDRIEPNQVQELLQRLFTGQPVIVEGRP